MMIIVTMINYLNKLFLCGFDSLSMNYTVTVAALLHNLDLSPPFLADFQADLKFWPPAAPGVHPGARPLTRPCRPTARSLVSRTPFRQLLVFCLPSHPGFF